MGLKTAGFSAALSLAALGAQAATYEVSGAFRLTSVEVEEVIPAAEGYGVRYDVRVDDTLRTSVVIDDEQLSIDMLLDATPELDADGTELGPRIIEFDLPSSSTLSRDGDYSWTLTSMKTSVYAGNDLNILRGRDDDEKDALGALAGALGLDANFDFSAVDFIELSVSGVNASIILLGDGGWFERMKAAGDASLERVLREGAALGAVDGAPLFDLAGQRLAGYLVAEAVLADGETVTAREWTPPTTAPVPLPAPALMLLAGLGALGLARRAR